MRGMCFGFTQGHEREMERNLDAWHTGMPPTPTHCAYIHDQISIYPAFSTGL